MVFEIDRKEFKKWFIKQVNKPIQRPPTPDIDIWREDYKVKKILSLAGTSSRRAKLLEDEVLYHVPIPDNFNIKTDLKTYPELIFANNYADKIVHFNHNLGDVANNIILRKKFRCYFTFAKALDAYKRTKHDLIKAKINKKKIMDFY